MAAAAKEIYTEMFMDERIARLEADTEHLQKDVTRIEQKIDKLDQKIDHVAENLEGKVDAVDKKIDRVAEKLEEKIGAVDKKIDAVKDALTAFQLQMTKGRWVDRIWWLVICGGVLGIMARGFKWI